MWKPESTRARILIIMGTSLFTMAVHYSGWLLEPMFGHVHWVHAIHGRLCYIPIVIAAAWFGLRGGLITAGAISLLVLPYILGSMTGSRDFFSEMTEIVFYFAIATIVGILVEREIMARQSEQDAQLKAERSQKLSMVGQIAAGMAHEVKNPLASIKGAADILTDDETTHAEREEFKGIMRNEIKRIDSALTEFLEFARPKKIELKKIDFTRSLRETLRQVNSQAKQVGVTIKTDLVEGVFINGDNEKLHQMILNLMLNAMQAAQETGVIDITMKTQPEHKIKLIIADNGTGIKNSDLEHLFEPFFTTKPTGIGLGLAVVKDIIDSHEGSIHIESIKSEGTKVTVVLPRIE